MKILIVAHPDDEMLWFNPEYFDRIFIVFSGRNDKPDFEEKRTKLMAALPYSSKIELFGITESLYNKYPEMRDRFNETKIHLLNKLASLKNLPITEIFTHNYFGEYYHYDHILVNHCVRQIFKSSVNIYMPTLLLKRQLFRDDITAKKLNLKTLATISINMNIRAFKLTRKQYKNQGIWTWNDFYKPRKIEHYYLDYL